MKKTLIIFHINLNDDENGSLFFISTLLRLFTEERERKGDYVGAWRSKARGRGRLL